MENFGDVESRGLWWILRKYLEANSCLVSSFSFSFFFEVKEIYNFSDAND